MILTLYSIGLLEEYQRLAATQRLAAAYVCSSWLLHKYATNGKRLQVHPKSIHDGATWFIGGVSKAGYCTKDAYCIDMLFTVAA